MHFAPLRRNQRRRPSFFGRQSQIKCQFRQFRHEPVIMVIAADLILRQFGTGGAHTHYPGATEGRGKRATLPGQIAITDEAR